jgi:hypothetical protein
VAKAACKEVAEWLGRVIRGNVAPKINPRKEAEEIAQIKAEARTKERAGVEPTPAPKPEKKRAPGEKGKPPAKNVGAPTKKNGCRHSFDPATRVLMADGSNQRIDEIDEGDKVLAHDPETGDTTAETVEALHVNQDEDLTDLSVRTKDGTFVTLKTTQHHPFWSDSRSEWVDAADLRPTERLRTASGELVTVAKVVNYLGRKTMRDLTVASVHTYYVLAGGTPVLVHNNNGDGACGLPGEEVDDGTIARLEARVDAIMESGIGKRRRPGTVGETVGIRPSGLLVVVQTQSGAPGWFPGRLFQALTACSHDHGGCSEVSGIARVFALGATPLQTTVMGVLSKRVGREWHRKTMDPCVSCRGLLSALGMTWRR